MATLERALELAAKAGAPAVVLRAGVHYVRETLQIDARRFPKGLQIVRRAAAAPGARRVPLAASPLRSSSLRAGPREYWGEELIAGALKGEIY